jgi:hypothetical protein
VKNAILQHVWKREMDNTTPDTFRVRTAKIINESPKNNAMAIRKIAAE